MAVLDPKTAFLCYLAAKAHADILSVWTEGG